MFDGPIGLVSEIVESWLRGGRALRASITIAIAFVGIALVANLLGGAGLTNQQYSDLVANGLGVIAAILAVGVIAYHRALDASRQHRRIEDIEKRYEENPKEPVAAWDLARAKLEHYLNRNIAQVSAIFWLTLLVMLFGFGLIAFGVYTIYEHPEKMTSSLVASVSGILVNFVGATFLVIYRSTMQQAKEYVGIIERINAVGMSVQVLEMLGDGAEGEALKDKTAAEISKQLLGLYTQKSDDA